MAGLTAFPPDAIIDIQDQNRSLANRLLDSLPTEDPLDGTWWNSNGTAIKSTPTEVFDIYVDSESGSDENDGLHPSRPLATLAAALSQVAEGGSVGLAAGSLFRESYSDDSGEAFSFGSYGTGAMPNVLGSDIATGWTLTEGRTSTYQISWTHEAVSQGRLVAFEDDLILVRVATVDLCESTPGSFTTGDANGSSATSPTTVYIHASDSTNPNSNGKQYEITRRDRVLKGDAGLSVTGLEIGRQIANNGSYDGNTAGVLKDSLCRDGHKHNGLMGTGEIENVVFFGCDPPTPSEPSNVPMVHYLPSVEGLAAPTIRNAGYIHQADGVSGTNAFYAHDSSSGRYASCRYYDGFAKGVGLIGGFSCYDFVAERFFATNCRAIASPVGASSIEFRYLIYTDDTPVTGLTGSGTRKLTDSVCVLGDSATEFIRIQNNSTHVYTRTLFAMTNRAFMLQVSAANASIAMNNCIIAGSPGLRYYVDLSNTNISYAADYNIFYRPGSPQIKCRGSDNFVYAILSDWQSHTGQDLNSVWLTDAQYASFFVGDPYAGDTRIAEGAEATAADGSIVTAFPDGTPFTTAGPAMPQIAIPRIPLTLDESRDFIAGVNGPWFGKDQVVWGSH